MIEISIPGGNGFLYPELAVDLEISGEYACFTSPSPFRMSYPIPTGSGLRGFVDSIRWEKGMRWIPLRLTILNPIAYTQMTNNLRKKKIDVSRVMSWIYDPGNYDQADEAEYYKEHMTITSTVLKDVRYVLTVAPMLYTSDPAPAAKESKILARRVAGGQCWRRPCLGLSNFSGHFQAPESDVRPIEVTEKLGRVLYDWDHSKGQPQQVYFEAKIESGVVNMHPLDVLKAENMGVLACHRS